MKNFLSASTEWARMPLWQRLLSLSFVIGLALVVQHLVGHGAPGLFLAFPNTLVTPTNVMKRIGRRLVNNVKFGGNVMRSLICQANVKQCELLGHPLFS